MILIQNDEYIAVFKNHFKINSQDMLLFRRRVVVYIDGFVGRLVGWLVGRLVGLQNILKNSKSRFGEYVAVFCTLINTLLIIVLYRHGRWSVRRLVGRSVHWLVRPFSKYFEKLKIEVWRLYKCSLYPH